MSNVFRSSKTSYIDFKLGLIWKQIQTKKSKIHKSAVELIFIFMATLKFKEKNWGILLFDTLFLRNESKKWAKKNIDYKNLDQNNNFRVILWD